MIRSSLVSSTFPLLPSPERPFHPTSMCAVYTMGNMSLHIGTSDLYFPSMAQPVSFLFFLHCSWKRGIRLGSVLTLKKDLSPMFPSSALVFLFSLLATESHMLLIHHLSSPSMVPQPRRSVLEPLVSSSLLLFLEALPSSYTCLSEKASQISR